MAGAAKRRANAERDARLNQNGSSSGETSSSGKASGDARSHTSDVRSVGGQSVQSMRLTGSRLPATRPPQNDGNQDPGEERNPATARVQVDPRNLDLGMGGWSTVRGYEVPTQLPARSKPSALGQPIKVGLNTFNVEKFPDKAIYQFEVLIGSGVEKRGLVKKVWQSKAVRDTIGKGWIFDGEIVSTFFVVWSVLTCS